jgi:hypothetical protein
MFQPRHDMPGSIRPDEDSADAGSVHGLIYVVPISLLLWAVILFWLFLLR